MWEKSQILKRLKFYDVKIVLVYGYSNKLEANKIMRDLEKHGTVLLQIKCVGFFQVIGVSFQYFFKTMRGRLFWLQKNLSTQHKMNWLLECCSAILLQFLPLSSTQLFTVLFASLLFPLLSSYFYSSICSVIRLIRIYRNLRTT